MKCQLFYLNVIFWIPFKYSFTINISWPFPTHIWNHTCQALSSVVKHNRTFSNASNGFFFGLNFSRLNTRQFANFDSFFITYAVEFSTFRCYFYILLCIFWYAWKMLLFLFSKLQANCNGLIGRSLPWTRFISSYVMYVSLLCCRDY